MSFNSLENLLFKVQYMMASGQVGRLASIFCPPEYYTMYVIAILTSTSSRKPLHLRS